MPLLEAACIRQRGTATEHCAGRLDVGTSVEQRVERLDVVATCRPVQGCLLMSSTEPRVDLRAGPDQRRHGHRDVGEVPGPVGGDVEQRARRT